MSVIMTGCNKGGAAKTTTAINLAIALAMEGKDVCLVDADPQRSAARWYQDRAAADLKPSITLIEAQENIKNTLDEMRKKFDFVIVDVAGRNSRELITGAVAADLIIAPHQVSQLDLDTLEELDHQVTRIKDLNPNLNVLVYHTRASTNPMVSKTEPQEFKDFVSQFPQFHILESCTHERKAYKDVIPGGKSVLEHTDPKAINETNALLEELKPWLQ